MADGFRNADPPIGGARGGPAHALPLRDGGVLPRLLYARGAAVRPNPQPRMQREVTAIEAAAVPQSPSAAGEHTELATSSAMATAVSLELHSARGCGGL